MKSMDIKEGRPSLPEPTPEPPKKKNVLVELAKDFLVGSVALITWHIMSQRRHSDDQDRRD